MISMTMQVMPVNIDDNDHDEDCPGGGWAVEDGTNVIAVRQTLSLSRDLVSLINVMKCQFKYHRNQWSISKLCKTNATETCST